MDLCLGARVQLYVAHMAQSSSAATLAALPLGLESSSLYSPLFFILLLSFLLLSLLTLWWRAAVQPIIVLWTFHIWRKKRHFRGEDLWKTQAMVYSLICMLMNPPQGGNRAAWLHLEVSSPVLFHESKRNYMCSVLHFLMFRSNTGIKNPHFNDLHPLSVSIY